MSELAARLVAALTDRRLTLATAESLTAGGVAAAVAAVPGASLALLGGVVTYATAQKTRLLGVSPDLLRQDGVVSEGTAVAMARGVVDLTGADIGVATTGVAGPGALEGQPVGTVHVAVAWSRAHPGDPSVRSFVAGQRLTGDRAEVRARTVAAALGLVLAVVRESGRWSRC